MTKVDLDGVLPVDKPAGPTSHDVVAMARRSLGIRRIGHTGTLDPFASGLLLLCVGQATRIAEYLAGETKRYSATVRLGTTTDTDDFTGTVVAESDAWRDLTRAAATAVVATFAGDLMQVPSAYSAKKRSGVRAYDAARQGRALVLDPVPVHIDEIRVTAWRPPDLELDVSCSTGTYVRALARDIGAALGTGAHLTALRRTAIGAHDVASALTPDELDDPERVAAALIAPLDALDALARIDLDPAERARVRHGRTVERPHPPGTVVLAADGHLAAIGHADGRVIHPRKVFGR